LKRVVLDTNVLVSGVRFGGKPRILLQRIVLSQFVLIVSEDILAELARVLSVKFSWHSALIASTLNRIRIVADMADPEFVLTDCADPDDNRILEAAVEGRADYIVSGDKRHLLRMKSFRGIEILTVSDFLQRLEMDAAHG
jgi:putative PIN family toxin of toxin-antitoxin system